MGDIDFKIEDIDLKIITKIVVENSDIQKLKKQCLLFDAEITKIEKNFKSNRVQHHTSDVYILCNPSTLYYIGQCVEREKKLNYNGTNA